MTRILGPLPRIFIQVLIRVPLDYIVSIHLLVLDLHMLMRFVRSRSCDRKELRMPIVLDVRSNPFMKTHVLRTLPEDSTRVQSQPLLNVPHPRKPVPSPGRPLHPCNTSIASW